MIDGSQKEAETPVSTDYEEVFGIALALLEEASFAIGEQVYKARSLAQKALEEWGKEEKDNAYPYIAAAHALAWSLYSEACYLEAFGDDLIARHYQEKARRGNQKAEVEAIFWKAQADIARQKAGHYPTRQQAIQAFEKAYAEGLAQEDQEAREEADAQALEALAQSSETAVQADQTEADKEGPSPFV